MSRHENFNEKGVSDVNNANGSRTTRVEEGSPSDNEKLFDSAKAEVIRDESRWDAFELIGDTNAEERTYRASRPETESPAKWRANLVRARKFVRSRGKKTIRAMAIR